MRSRDDKPSAVAGAPTLFQRRRRLPPRALFLILLLPFIFTPYAPFAGEDTAPSTSGKRQPAPVMSHLGADWLERPGRAEEERPELVIAAMELKDGDTVADIGCGSGFFTRRIAKAVAPTGKVYGVDIQPEMLEILKENCAGENITNVIPVLGGETDPKLPKGEIDWILLVDTYHEFQDPAVMLGALLDALAPGGKIALVEYRAEDDSAAHIKPEHRMSVKQVLAEWNPAGFELIDLIETLPTQHLFIFHKRPKRSE